MQDQYILHTAEAQNITLPFACRHGIDSYTLDNQTFVFLIYMFVYLFLHFKLLLLDLTGLMRLLFWKCEIVTILKSRILTKK